MSIRKTLAAFALSLLTSAVVAAEPMKLGFVYVGPVGDHGWSYQHDLGRKDVEKHFGDQVKTSFVENVAEGADAERVIRKLAQAGNKVIFTTSFGFMNPTEKVAKDFPNTVFLHATGYKRSKNMGTYLSKTYEGRYVSGTVAGMVTKSGKIGYIASFPIPEVIRDINSVQLALNKSHPGAEMKIVWVNTWFDPAKEADAANSLIDQGVDVIIQHTDSPAAMTVAEKRGIYAVGQASDMSRFGPNAHLLSVTDEWAPYYIKTVQEVMDGTWKSEDYWGGIAEGDIGIVKLNEKLPADVIAKAKEVEEGMRTKTLHPFTGPIYDQDGKLRVAEGQVMTNEELAGMDWYVQGITAKLPK